MSSEQMSADVILWLFSSAVDSGYFGNTHTIVTGIQTNWSSQPPSTIYRRSVFSRSPHGVIIVIEDLYNTVVRFLANVSEFIFTRVIVPIYIPMSVGGSQEERCLVP